VLFNAAAAALAFYEWPPHHYLVPADTYTFLVFFTMVNFFLAIVMEAYDEVRKQSF